MRFIGRRESKEDKVKRKLEWEREKKYIDALVDIEIFPGNLAQYEIWKGYDLGAIVPCETGSKAYEIFLRFNAFKDGKRYARVINDFDVELRANLVEQGIVAIVNAQPIQYQCDRKLARYGMPVKKKE